MALLLTCMGLWPSAANAADLVLWAWERPENLQFLDSSNEIAVQTGFVVLCGGEVRERGRRFAVNPGGARVTTAVVHIQIDHQCLKPTAAAEAAAARAALGLARTSWANRVQIDFEVRAGERPILLRLLGVVKSQLPPNVELSMTALASWCENETWLSQAPVDEIVPMLFRMGPAGETIKARLAAGEDFQEPRCRRALAISTDAPLPRAPAGRRVYLFDPQSWTAANFERLRREAERWRDDGSAPWRRP